MLKFIKKGLLLPLMLAVCCIPLTANASVESDDKVFQGYDKKKKEYFVCAQYNPSHKIQRGEDWELETNKYVKQAYVRAKSDGRKILFKICGSYDSGRQYSVAAPSKTNKIFQTSRETVKKCATCTQRTYYGWLYFNK